MDKLYLTHIEEEIEERANLNPTKIDFVDFNTLEQPYPALEYEVNQWNYYKALSRGKVRSNDFVRMTRSRAIRLMSGGAFASQLAIDLKIDQRDIIEYRSKLEQTKIYINDLEHDWKRSIIDRGLKEHLIETVATNDYYNKIASLNKGISLRTVLAQYRFMRTTPPTRYAVEEELKLCSSRINEANNKILELKEQLHNKEITNASYEKSFKKLTNIIRREIFSKKKQFRNMFLNEESKKRITFIRAVPNLNSDVPNNDYLSVTSFRHGLDLLANYRDWYNDLHAAEIEEFRIARKKEGDKQYYSNKLEVTEKRNSKKDKQVQFAGLIDEGYSQAEAGRQVGITSSTANRWANDPKICTTIAIQ